jgi:serine/threonine protein kinase
MAEVKLTLTWQVGESLGSGGFGEVFRAVSGDDVAAIKFVPKAPGADRELLFVELADVANVIPIIDSGATDTRWLLLMPLAECSLRQRMAAGEIDAAAGLQVLVDVATALASLDGCVVHRDIKPENILFYDGHWCLADFGISRYAEATTAEDTRKHALSAPYAAPERWRFERATSATDVYSVGVLAYELLAGRLPFPGPTRDDYGEQHLHKAPLPLDGVTTAMAALIDECLIKAPGARPTPRDLLARLGNLAAPTSSSGLARLSEAHRAEVSRSAERARVASAQQTEAQRRSELLTAANQLFGKIGDELRDAIVKEAPSAQLGELRGGGWSLRLGDATLSMTQPVATTAQPWGPIEPVFEVIAHSKLSLGIPRDRFDYGGDHIRCGSVMP